MLDVMPQTRNLSATVDGAMISNLHRIKWRQHRDGRGRLQRPGHAATGGKAGSHLSWPAADCRPGKDR